MMKKRSSKASNIANNIKAKTNDVKRKVVKGTSKTSKRKMSKNKKIILNILIICVIAFASLMAVFFAYIIVKAPKFDPNNLKFTQMSELYDTEGNIITKMGNENRTEISYDDLPEVLIDAIIATEDSKFFQHNGFDLARFMKASMYQLVGKNGGGASTLTMQIAKNNYTSTESKGFEGITRKFTDIYLSIFKIERKYTKKEILEFYVNTIYFGDGYYGVDEACNGYFKKSSKDMSLYEATMLAGIPNAPSVYAPTVNKDLALNRQRKVISTMVENEYLTQEQADELIKMQEKETL